MCILFYLILSISSNFINRMVEIVHQGLSEDNPNIESDHYRKQIGKIKLCLYTFGAPRVGNSFFAQQMNNSVPNSFRIGNINIILSFFLLLN